MPESQCLRVEVVYAEPEAAYRVSLRLPEGSTVADAISRSGLREARPDVAPDADRLGIFSRKAGMQTLLRDGDRVEIYRPLKVDPKEARRRRARDSQARDD